MRSHMVLNPKIATTARQINGRINEKLTSGIYPKIFELLSPGSPISKIHPCNTGIKTPHTIAITNPAEPILASPPMLCNEIL